jgi:signal transduction histidine kinase
MNLIDNAVKYTDQGTISIRTYQQAQSVVIEVADTGIGISPNDIPLIFNRFLKGDKARSSGGSGLGLAITKKIVEAHGGKVEVKSAPGQGTTFTVSIPIYPAETSN